MRWIAGGAAEPGRDMPIASAAEAMVFAVYMPPQAPSPGHTARSIASTSASVILPARQAPTGTSAGVGAGGPRRGLLGRLFAEPEPARPEITEGAAVEYIRGFAARRPEYGVRIYRTRAGLRVILTGVRETADTEAAQGLLTELGADPRYSALARGHASYRARLTPKPWRAGWHALPVSGRGRFWEGGEDDPTWLAAYRERTAQFAVCRLLEVIGHGGSATEGEVIAFHDSATRVGSPDPLA